MTTLKDLSRHLNLSVTQVSRALNDHADVSEETRRRVKEAAIKLKYQPNVAARKLVSGRSGIVGLVLPNMPKMAEAPIFVQTVGGMSAHFARRRMQFVLNIADESEPILEIYRRLISGGSLDGFVLLEPVRDDPRIEFLQSQKVPFVVHGRDREEPDYPYFDIDNFGVAHRLTRYLTDQGHRRIAFLNGREGLTFVEARREGYRSALGEAGLRYDPHLHLCADMEEGFGIISAVRLFSENPRPPTAVIAGNLRIAKGLYDALRAMHLSVPQDVSVVAHDDLLPDIKANAFDPPLTTTQSALELSWEPLAEFLAGAVANVPAAALQKLGELRFVERESVAPPQQP
ncbi:substrate-binding domain-containing protein [Ostreiculturibacter nitratireducens]|uniref:substrate-binding domain-containing protein n=1 Tax=Ostreiculturibacter nitratireducens TaxID=3075226 RepID=UPI0031B648CF